MNFRKSHVLPYVFRSALMVAVPGLALCYWVVDKLINSSSHLLYVSTGLVMLVVTFTIGFFRFYHLHRLCRLHNLVPAGWLSQGLFLAFLIMVLVLALDGVVSLVDNSLARAYAQALQQHPQSLLPTPAEETLWNVFRQLPLMVQALFITILGTATGGLIAASFAQKLSGRELISS